MDGVPRNCEAPSPAPAPSRRLLGAPGPAVAISYLYTFLRHGGSHAGLRESPHYALSDPLPGRARRSSSAQGRGRGSGPAPPFLPGPLFRFRLRGSAGSTLAPPLLLCPKPRRAPGVCTLRLSAQTSGRRGGAASAVGHMSPRCAGSASSRPSWGRGRIGRPLRISGSPFCPRHSSRFPSSSPSPPLPGIRR